MRILNVNISLAAQLGGRERSEDVQLSRVFVRLGGQCECLVTDLGLVDKSLRGLGPVSAVPVDWLIRRFHVPMISPRRLVSLVRSADVIYLKALNQAQRTGGRVRPPDAQPLPSLPRRFAAPSTAAHDCSRTGTTAWSATPSSAPAVTSR